MNEHQGDKIIDILAEIRELLQHIEDKLDNLREEGEPGNQLPGGGLFR